jgi:tetratricopeptide (TPR) repeat protein
MDRRNANSTPPGSGHNDERSRDTPALCVFVGLLVALLVAGYFALKNLDMNTGFRPGSYVREWISDLEEEVKDLLGDATKDLKIPVRGSADAKTHLLKGYRLHRQKSYPEALEELNKAIDLDPRNAEAYYWRGRTQVNLGRLDQGVDDFKKAVEFKPDYSEAYDHLGWLAAKQGQVNEAIAFLTKSVEFKPENAWAFYNRSRLFFGKGDVANAMKDAEKACGLGYQDGCKAYESYKNSPKQGGQGSDQRQ